MISLIVYAVAAFGFAYIAGHSKISLPLRQLVAPAGKPDSEMTASDVARAVLILLIECPACLGFWQGIAAWYLWRQDWMPGPFHVAVFTCGANLLLSKLAGLLDE